MLETLQTGCLLQSTLLRSYLSTAVGRLVYLTKAYIIYPCVAGSQGSARVEKDDRIRRLLTRPVYSASLLKIPDKNAVCTNSIEVSMYNCVGLLGTLVCRCCVGQDHFLLLVYSDYTVTYAQIFPIVRSFLFHCIISLD